MSSRDDRLHLDGASLDRLWDAMNRQIAPIPGKRPTPVTDAAETIARVQKLDDAPQLGASEMDSLWSTIAAATLAPAVEPQRAASSPSLTQLFGSLVQSVIRQGAIGALGGMLVGFLVLGGGLRLLMRISAMLTDTGGYQMVTQNGNVVGEVTIEGTLSIMIFVGAMFGALGGIIVMAVRPWLPASGWSRYLLAGAIGFAVAAPAALEQGDNPDYQRFGILGLNVCLFTILPLLFGISVLPVLDALDRRISHELPRVSRSGWVLVKSVGLIVLSLPLIVSIPAALGTPPIGLLLLLPVVKVLADYWSDHAPTRMLKQQRQLRGEYLGRVLLTAPCLIGLVLTAQAVGRLTS
jgi:hypothetical protein